MGGKYLLILFLILLVACEPELRSTPTSEYMPIAEATPAPETTDLCASVTCPAGQNCLNGNCTCDEGKMCNGDCISEQSCCMNNDCETGVCDDGECITPEDCTYGEEFKDGECQCTKDKTWCGEQRKCISRDSCCAHIQCDKFERCVPTLLRTSICLEIGEKKMCKLVADNGRAEIFNALNDSFRITPTEWYNDGSLEFEINNQTIRIPTNTTTEYAPANATIYHEGITSQGGYCKEDEED